MGANRVAITLCHTEPFEQEEGVWEDRLIERKVKAQKETIFQKRRDQARVDGLVLTARFKIRGVMPTDNLDYVKWNGARYKVSSIHQLDYAHDYIIEIGELI
ncbi:MAG: phage head-tail adapter protein [Coriobacteriia bacterium]|nr:phage head-tail adapter protein [Coriobacteriia bacterium]